MFIKLLITFFTLFALHSCSWITDFYMLNSSKDPVVVTFKMPIDSGKTTPYLEKLKVENPSIYQKIKPAFCPLEKEIESGKYPEVCNKNFVNCRVLNSEEYKFDKKECSLELNLESNQAVKLFSICCSYTGVKDDNESKDINQSDEGDTMNLTIKSAYGITQYKGVNMMRAFKKREKTRYVLEHKGVK